MSRSYKKNPWCGDHKGKKKKRVANHKVRSWLKQNPAIKLKPGDYKKIYETWDICDYCWKEEWENYWKSELRAYYYFNFMYLNRKNNDFPDKKETYRKWYKYYKMK